MEKNTKDRSTLSQAGSLVSLFHSQEKEKEPTMTAISGRKCLGLLESLNQPTLLAKMFMDSSIWRMAKHLTKYTLIWKTKATKSNRLLFQLAPSERGTGATGYGLLLTPTSVMIDETPDQFQKRKEKNGYKDNTKWASLPMQVKNGFPMPKNFLLTPTATQMSRTQEGMEKRKKYRESIGRKYVEGTLEEQVLNLERKLLPTPTHRDYKGTGNVERVRNGKIQKDTLDRGCGTWHGWEVEPGMGRVVDGIPGRVDRIKQLGNAIVPQVAYEIFKIIQKMDSGEFH